MKILVIASDLPMPSANAPAASAVNVVASEMLRELRAIGHDVVLQLLFSRHRAHERLDPTERAALESVARMGVAVLEPIYPSAYRSPGGRLIRLRRLAMLAAGSAEITSPYPSTRVTDLVRERALRELVDVVLTVWSPDGVAASAWREGPPVVAYHGDIDFQPGLCRYRDGDLFGDGPRRRGLLAAVRDRLWLTEFQRAHLRTMRSLALIANVTASNADFYRRRGHPASVYARNMWPTARAELTSPSGRGGRIEIVGHAGRLDATGSAYGLRSLLADVVPQLETELAGIDYRVHVIGGGELPPGLRRYARDPRLVFRGYVPDLDATLRGSSAYLLLNNSGPYRAAFTRHLVAWSVGACLIVHANSRAAIPEILHEENALVGSNAAEIAAAVLRAVTDRALNERVRRGGLATHKRAFTPSRVVGDLSDQIGRLVS